VTYIEDPSEALRDVHEKFIEFVQAWDDLVSMTRHHGRFAASVDAYKPFVRDQGMGDDPFDWMQSAATELDLVLKWGGDDDFPDKFELKSVESANPIEIVVTGEGWVDFTLFGGSSLHRLYLGKHHHVVTEDGTDWAYDIFCSEYGVEPGEFDAAIEAEKEYA